MKSKAKLAFEMLEQEIELMSSGELENFIGGSGIYIDGAIIDIDQYGHTVVSYDGGCSYSNLGGNVTFYGSSNTGGSYDGWDAMSLMIASGGTAATWAQYAAEVGLGSDAAAGFISASRYFVYADIGYNGYELLSGNGSWEDAGQIALAGAVIASGGSLAFVLGTGLAGWELYEYYRDHQ
ncbi:hypothetical protein I5M32_06005 [Pedobacter sp. SD-b]|uniref:Uncharacterized protein n=1 Tax=Pedobacter segetis TaxID=2793069 RepID=A0ABS1BJI7_9SPHI|nr:hypothetical protein [Pedobacter segetis]MBK0382511.1 hypothetical protein [Pedobacter segetis]